MNQQHELQLQLLGSGIFCYFLSVCRPALTRNKLNDALTCCSILCFERVHGFHWSNFGYRFNQIGDNIFLRDGSRSSPPYWWVALRHQSHPETLQMVSYNFIEGKIPHQFDNDVNINILDLSYNNLTGKIPKSLRPLKEVNLSYNSLVGPIPEYLSSWFSSDLFWGNKYLCGNLPDFSPCPSTPSNKLKIVEIILPVLCFLAFLTLGVLLFLRSRAKDNIPEPNVKKNGDLFSILNFDGRIAFEDIIEATNDFDIRYCIGTGGYGCVYRAQLPSGKIVALKKLHRRESEVLAFDKSFKNEAKMLSEIRHKNIVKLHGFCLHNRCMFLIYEYMAGGSLFCVFLDNTEALELDWIKRVKTVKDTACALSYLHHDWHPAIVYRDISSYNILLNSNLEACISDFGTARLLDPDSSNQTMLVRTNGYIAPALEYWHLKHSWESIPVNSCNNGLCLLKFEPKVPTQELPSRKRLVAHRLQAVSLLQLKDHDLYMDEGRIQSQNSGDIVEIQASSST
ncbi:MDIS1-interacting receptor like kinase 2 [Gossypium hirsutum]|uniref:non-specific serine/threonine protein kinase n=1 Tax=Gossypium hirsutum TaxID=3635 RepID=A0A1U8I439_GOSHI|nr:MDIS1-interacting receptor like kinase 2-like [Gossypium hirsutum]